MAGRPSSYTPELAAEVCEAIRTAKSGMRKLLDDSPTLPTYATALRWADKHPDFEVNLAQARASRLKGWVEDIIDISDDDSLDPADKRVRVDTRKWVLSKELHRIYGDKLDVTSGGEALPQSSTLIDQRIQSIVMQAQARRLAGLGGADGVTIEADALKLLE